MFRCSSLYLKVYLNLFLVGVFFGMWPESSFADEAQITQVFRPMGFDDNDRAEIIVAGTLPNACYRISGVEKKVDTNRAEVEFTIISEKYRDFCLQMVIDYLEPVKLDVLPTRGREEVEYQIFSKTNGIREDRGSLPIQRAVTRTRQDEFLYAPVDSLTVIRRQASDLERSEDPSRFYIDEVVLYGHFPNSCLEFVSREELKDRGFYAVQKPDPSQNMIEVLPIVQETDDFPCIAKKTPFVVSYPIPKEILPGEHLFYVRIMDGFSFFKKDFIPGAGSLKTTRP